MQGTKIKIVPCYVLGVTFVHYSPMKSMVYGLNTALIFCVERLTRTPDRPLTRLKPEKWFDAGGGYRHGNGRHGAGIVELDRKAV